MISHRIENDVKCLLQQHPKGLVFTDMGTFRHRLKTGGHKLADVVDTVRYMRNGRVIRLRQVNGGTRVRLVNSKC